MYQGNEQTKLSTGNSLGFFPQVEAASEFLYGKGLGTAI